MLVYSLNIFIKIIGFFIKWIYRIVSLNKGTGDTDYVKAKKE
ncbi:hypothetical protein IKG_04987 [Bacillus cereus VD200]|nr:hypothetical protein IKG_04987 [Bacillus cereus VD200]